MATHTRSRLRRRPALLWLAGLGCLFLLALALVMHGRQTGTSAGHARGAPLPAAVATLRMGTVAGVVARTATPTPVPSPTLTPAPPPGGYRQVVARADMPASTVFTTTGSISASFVEAPAPGQPPAGAFASLASLAAFIQAGHGGRYTTAPLYAGRVVLSSDLADIGDRTSAGVALRLPPGHVAESVTVAPLQSANAGVIPGDTVDVLLTLSTDQLYGFRTADQPAGPQETQQLLQGVLVVAAAPPVYTLALRLQDALVLKYVKDSANATVELVPRSSQDAGGSPLHTAPILPEYFVTHLRSAFIRPGWPRAVPTPRPALSRKRGLP